MTDMPELKSCPMCNGPLQQTQHLDADDRVVSMLWKCRRKFPGKKKKGCGYQIHGRSK